MTPKQLAANRRNARKSTGPRTAAGRAVSRMNAVKHGILSTEVVVRGLHAKESQREFTALHQRFRDELQPAGPVEEMLVDQIVTARWRMRRAMRAESGEIALDIERHEMHHNAGMNSYRNWLSWLASGNAVLAMQDSWEGVCTLERWLLEVREAVERDGELTEAATRIPLHGEPNAMTTQLEKLRQRLRENPEGLDEPILRERNRREVVVYLDREIERYHRLNIEYYDRERWREKTRQDTSMLPALPVLEKIMRYETKLERQMYRAMAQLERVQRIRRGEAVPAPLSVAVTERCE